MKDVFVGIYLYNTTVKLLLIINLLLIALLARQVKSLVFISRKS